MGCASEWCKAMAGDKQSSTLAARSRSAAGEIESGVRALLWLRCEEGLLTGVRRAGPWRWGSHHLVPELGGRGGTSGGDLPSAWGGGDGNKGLAAWLTATGERASDTAIRCW
jgi:hypothetical protein